MNIAARFIAMAGAGAGSALREVEYVQCDFSVPWVLPDGSEIDGSTTNSDLTTGVGVGYDLSRYVSDGETVGSFSQPLSIVASARLSNATARGQDRVLEFVRPTATIKSFYGFSLVYAAGTAPVVRFGTYMNSATPASHANEANYPVGIDVFRTYTMTFALSDSDKKDIYGGIDGDVVLVRANASTTSTATLPCIALFRNHPRVNGGCVVRLKSVKIGADVDLVPVRQGAAVGFLNRVDGEVFLSTQPRFTAGADL